jgi:hypothetical protein
MRVSPLICGAVLVLLTACPTEGGPCKTTSDCPKGRTCCDGKCNDTENDRNNCGACGAVCAFPNVVPSCKVGRCQFQCQAGFGNCNDQRDDGCEVKTSESAENCGVCGRACMSTNAASVCAVSLCGLGTCNAGFANCDEDPVNGCEIETKSDVANCAGCGQQCALPNATPRCEASTCEVESCDAGFGNCDQRSPNGCEISLTNDALNCGGCGVECWPGQYCAASRCRANELIIFGGAISFSAGNTTGDVYKFDLISQTFTALNPATPDGPIPGRQGHVATFDFARNRMVVWGGIDGAGTLSTTETWELDFKVTPPVWRKVTTTGTPPSARFGMAAAQDPVSAKWYLFGGSTDLGEGLSELFTLDLATNTWARVHGPNAAGAPGNRVNSMAAFDAAAREFIVFGGSHSTTRADLRELWRFKVTTNLWQTPAPTGPVARGKGAMFDGSPVYLFSGISSLLQPPVSMVEDFWALDVRATTPWVPQTMLGPGSRFSAAASARDNKLYVYGGGVTVGGVQTEFTELWVADPAAQSWTRLNEGLIIRPTGTLSATMVAR